MSRPLPAIRDAGSGMNWPEILLFVFSLWLVMTVALGAVCVATCCAALWWSVATPIRACAAFVRWVGR